MPCDRISLLKRLAVESPSQLQTPPWQEHMEDCGECRMEKQGLDGTLAVFKQIESEGRAQKEFGPSWEAFSQAVDHAETMQPIPSQRASGGSFGQMAPLQAQGQVPKARSFRRWRMMVSLASAASVATVAATVVGVMFWPVDPLPETPRKEASSAAPVAERAAGNAKSFRMGGGFPAPHAPLPSYSPGRSMPTPTPVVRELAVPAPSFGQNRWRGGAGSHPAPVILFRSLQNRKSMGMDKPVFGKPAERVSTRTAARPAKRRTKVGAAKRPVVLRSPKTAPPRTNRRPVATRSRAKGSPSRLGSGAVKPRIAVKPNPSFPATPFSPGASSGPQAPRPKAEAFTGNRPDAEPPLKKMLAQPDEKLKLQARMEAEEMAETDAETEMNEADLSQDDPESKYDAKPEDIFQPANVAP